MLTVFKGIGGALRGVGAAIDAAGVAVQGKLATSDSLVPSLTRLPLKGTAPAVAETAFVAPNAAVMGDVEIGANSSVWYGAVLRGDVQKIRVGHTTNIQDRVVVHVAKHNPNNTELPTIIGNKVTIGHGAIIHACTIEDEALIGMGAKVLDGAVVKRNAIVAAGAVVGPGAVVPSGEVWAGIPAKKLRAVDPEEADFISTSALNYAKLGKQHLDENTKVWLTVLHDDTLRYDIQTRDPNSDEAAGLVRDPETRHILAGPYDTQKQV